MRRLYGAGRPLPGTPHPPGGGARRRAAGEPAWVPEGGGLRREGAPSGVGALAQIRRGPGGRARSPGSAVVLALERGG